MANLIKEVVGFVIQKNEGGEVFLCRSQKFIEHITKEIKSVIVPGINRAYVHSEEFILKGGSWATGNILLWRAIYNPDVDFTQIIGEPILYNDFIKEFVKVFTTKKVL